MIHNIREEVVAACESRPQLEIQFAEVLCSDMNPSNKQNTSDQGMVRASVLIDDNGKLAGNRGIGGLVWKLREGRKMEDHLLFWIGSDNSAFANVVLTFNGCEIGIYITNFCMKFIQFVFVVLIQGSLFSFFFSKLIVFPFNFCRVGSQI